MRCERSLLLGSLLILVAAAWAVLIMGLEHGAYCLACCWLLFVIRFPLGMMNVAAMAVITFVIFAEQSLPLGPRIGQIGAAASIAYGILVIFVPTTLPMVMPRGIGME
jgi:predicted metal-binding membrane protein